MGAHVQACTFSPIDRDPAVNQGSAVKNPHSDSRKTWCLKQIFQIVGSSENGGVKAGSFQS